MFMPMCSGGLLGVGLLFGFRLFQNSRVQLAGSTIAANKFQDGYAGAGLHRQFGRSLRGFVSYQYNYLSFDTQCPIPGLRLPWATAAIIRSGV